MSASTLDLDPLRDAIASLADGLEVVGDSAWFTRQSSKVQNTLVAGVIQSFEFVYEIGVKMIRRRLELDDLVPGDVDRNNFRDLLRGAGDRGLVDDVEAWFNYRKMRNTTANTYNRAKAQEIYRDIGHFISDARSLLERLEARNG
jgi:nucleotidyltransferase substrate binding protein (TIGR01987 family)